MIQLNQQSYMMSKVDLIIYALNWQRIYTQIHPKIKEVWPERAEPQRRLQNNHGVNSYCTEVKILWSTTTMCPKSGVQFPTREPLVIYIVTLSATERQKVDPNDKEAYVWRAASMGKATAQQLAVYTWNIQRKKEVGKSLFVSC